MHKEKVRAVPTTQADIPKVTIRGKWQSALEGLQLERLERTVFTDYLRRSRWFGGKALTISRVKVTLNLPIAVADTTVFLVFMEVSYVEGAAETYIVPLHFLAEGEARELQKDFPEGVIARLETDSGSGLLYDGIYHSGLHAALFEMFVRKTKTQVTGGELFGNAGRMFRKMMGDKQLPLASHIGKMEQSNTTILYDNTFFFKFYRRVEEEINPEAEIGRFLTEKARFSHVPPFAGTLEYRRPSAKPFTIGILQGFIPNQSDGWTFTLHDMTQYAERILARREELKEPPDFQFSLLNIEPTDFPPLLQELVGGFDPEMASLLGRRTAELHLALGGRTDDPAFAPEPYSLLHQRSVFQSMRTQIKKVNALLRKKLPNLSPELGPEAEAVLALEKEILEYTKKFLEKKFSAMKTRIHGDYHLGQVLFTGKDFAIIDFEGEPAKAMSERRIKRSPLRDVAGMMHSFRYAAYAVLFQQAQVRAEDVPFLEPWMRAWYSYIGGNFLRSYLETAAQAPFLPEERGDIEVMLRAFMLDKAVYVLGYELNNRPEWVTIPLRELRAAGEALRQEAASAREKAACD